MAYTERNSLTRVAATRSLFGGFPRIYRLFALLAAVLLLPIFVTAQSTNGAIEGIVQDASQGVLPGAAITATNVATSVVYKATSNASGNYTIPFVPPGEYLVQATMTGFSTLKQAGVTVQVNQTVKLDLTLQAGSIDQTITVTDTPPPIDTQSGTVATLINNATVTQLPLNGRNVYALEGLVPGAAPGLIGPGFLYQA